MPKAAEPVRNRHSTGATARAVEGAEETWRRVTARGARCPGTAGAYPLRDFSAIFFAAAATAFSRVGKVVVWVCPVAPIRPYRTVTTQSATVTS